MCSEQNTAHSILVSTRYVPPSPLRFNTLKKGRRGKESEQAPSPFLSFLFFFFYSFHLDTQENWRTYTMFPQAFCCWLYLIIFHYVHKMICSCFVQQWALLFLLLLFIPFWHYQTAPVWLFLFSLGFFSHWWILMHFLAPVDIEWH